MGRKRAGFRFARIAGNRDGGEHSLRAWRQRLRGEGPVAFALVEAERVFEKCHAGSSRLSMIRRAAMSIMASEVWTLYS